MAFNFWENGAEAEFRYNGEPILRFATNRVYFGGGFSAGDQCFEPGAGPEINSTPLFGWFGHPLRGVDRVQYEVLEEGERLVVRLTPSHFRGGAAASGQVAESCTIGVALENGRFVWTQRSDSRILCNLELDRLESGDPDTPKIFRYPNPDGTPGTFLQFFDPQPVGGSGPAVPMTRDWIGVTEPLVGAEGFRKSWSKRYVRIVFQDPDGSLHQSALDKRKWFYLTRDNRRARRCRTGAPVYLVRRDGAALEITPTAPSHYHHVCEWGMDYHFWFDLAPFARDGVLPAGLEFAASTVTRLIDAAAMRPILERAAEIELAPRELEVADRPAYEEPVNTFARSALEYSDAFAWLPTSEGCFWDRDGGRRPGFGRLGIRNNYSDTGSWRVMDLGPNQWANPFLPGARYRLSGWVRVENFEHYIHEEGPQLGIDFIHVNGPWMLCEPVTVPGGWSKPLNNPRRNLSPDTDWEYVEVITPPCPGNVMVAQLYCRFNGRGIAYFTEVGWELLGN